MAIDTSAVLFTGPSGSGKSSAALWLLALGGRLVADDGVDCRRVGGSLITSCPPAISGQIEARGVGILAAETQEHAVLRLVVDLGKQEPDRLPPMRETEILGVALPVIYGAGNAHLAAAVIQYLKGGRTA